MAVSDHARLCYHLLLIGAFTFGTNAAAAQTYSCEPATSPHTLALQDYVTRLTGADPALVQKRGAYQLPAVTASQIQVIKTKSTCQQAAQAYNKAVRGDSAPQISRSVVVIKVGTNRYFVLDPTEREGEFEVTVIFDSEFKPLAAFNS
jgi:hypothetical protein